MARTHDSYESIALEFRAVSALTAGALMWDVLMYLIRVLYSFTFDICLPLSCQMCLSLSKDAVFSFSKEIPQEPNLQTPHLLLAFSYLKKE